MAQQRRKDQAYEAGVTHFPLEAEQESQERVPPPSEHPPAAGSRRGHRLSRSTNPPTPQEADARFEGKGGKGGKTGGSRAGLLSANRKTGKGRT